MTWVHSCVAVDSALNHLTVVVNGKKLEEKSFPIPEGAQPPTSLMGKLLVFKVYFGGFWYQSKNKVSNLNIFSNRMPLDEMVSRTAGNDCWSNDGDYLAWESAQWNLKGETSLGELDEEDLCRTESNIQIFTSPVGSLNQCKDICGKIKTEQRSGTMATMRSPKETKAFFNRLD